MKRGHEALSFAALWVIWSLICAWHLESGSPYLVFPVWRNNSDLTTSGKSFQALVSRDKELDQRHMVRHRNRIETGYYEKESGLVSWEKGRHSKALVQGPAAWLSR